MNELVMMRHRKLLALVLVREDRRTEA